MLTAVLAHELGPLRIRVNAVAPGLVRTELARALWDAERGPAEERLVPLGRLGSPPDIAAAVCFLASDDASWITGVTLRVDGGRFHVGGEPADLIGRFRPAGGTGGETGGDMALRSHLYRPERR
jgi:3-oxoacyl-[acyl-carrier protein] reductase